MHECSQEMQQKLCMLCQRGFVVEIEDQRCSYTLNGNILEVWPTGAYYHQFRMPIQCCPVCGREIGKVNNYKFQRF